eukprot:gene11942-2177_t
MRPPTHVPRGATTCDAGSGPDSITPTRTRFVEDLRGITQPPSAEDTESPPIGATMNVTVASSRGSRRESVSMPNPNATLGDLKRAYRPEVSSHRMSFKFVPKDGTPVVTLSGDGKTLRDLGVGGGDEVVFKDLGPQVGYRTVFVVEYAGPIAIMLLFACRPSLVYPEGDPMGDSARMWAGLFLMHFIKAMPPPPPREAETFLVHKFSRPTMPMLNIFKNSAYYWLFAAFIGYYLCHPAYTAPGYGLAPVAVAGWAVCQCLNLSVHLQLAGMRDRDGDTARRAPRGPLFFVSCPNYTFEVLGWSFFSFGTGIPLSWAFTVVGLLQMTDWARKKHRAYVKAEPELRKRKAIIPFVI